MQAYMSTEMESAEGVTEWDIEVTQPGGKRGHIQGGSMMEQKEGAFYHCEECGKRTRHSVITCERCDKLLCLKCVNICHRMLPACRASFCGGCGPSHDCSQHYHVDQIYRAAGISMAKQQLG